MKNSFQKILNGYTAFRNDYLKGNQSTLQRLSHEGQKPEIMVIACCDSRVDPALILQCDPGDLFVVRNIANIVPPYEKDAAHHGTSAALEFGICYLNIKHLIILGHSQCGGIQALLNNDTLTQNDFITNWVSLIDSDHSHEHSTDEYAQLALHKSHTNCLTFPWIVESIAQHKLIIHRWFFDIKAGQIVSYCAQEQCYKPLGA